jgi:hypothetical protein
MVAREPEREREREREKTTQETQTRRVFQPTTTTRGSSSHHDRSAQNRVPTPSSQAASDSRIFAVSKNGITSEVPSPPPCAPPPFSASCVLFSTILQRRAGEVYVHYVNSDKRLDEWLPESACEEVKEKTAVGKRKRKRSSLSSGRSSSPTSPRHPRSPLSPPRAITHQEPTTSSPLRRQR